MPMIEYVPRKFSKSSESIIVKAQAICEENWDNSKIREDRARKQIQVLADNWKDE